MRRELAPEGAEETLSLPPLTGLLQRLSAVPMARAMG
jgi:hypothetical protein